MSGGIEAEPVFGGGAQLARCRLHFEIVLKRDPENEEVHYQLGLALREGKPEGAIQELETALRLNPEHQAAYYTLGQMLNQLVRLRRRSVPPEKPAARDALEHGMTQARSGDLKAAIESFTKAIAVDPDFAQAHYHLGAAFWYSGEKARAAAELDTALELNPADGGAYILRGLAHREAGELAAALRAGQRAIALNSKASTAYFDLAVVLLRLKRLPQALGQFEAGLNLGNVSPDLDLAIRELRAATAGSQEAHAHVILGRMMGLAGAPPKLVIAELEAAIKIQPDDAEARNRLGLVYTQTGQDAPAIAAFREAIRIGPDFAEAHGNLGAILTETDVEEAIRELEKAIELQPGLLKAHYNLAVAYGSSPKHGPEREIAQLRKLLTLDANYPRANFALGKALLRTSSVAEAVTHLERATQIEPQNGQAHYQLGLALSRAGRAEDAARSLQKSRELIAAGQRDENIALDISEGKAALEKGEFEQAAATFRRVLNARPDLAEVQYQLGLALARKRDVSGAGAAFHKALELNPLHPMAKQELNRLSADDPRETATLERYILEGRFAEAEPKLAAYVKERPNSSWGWYALGYSYFAQRKIGDSIDALSKSLALNVANADAHKTLGRVLMIIGRFDAAQREFELGEKYDPKSAEMPFNLGRLFSIQDQWAPARAAFERAIRIDPSYMEAYDGLGFALEALGENEAAITNYSKAAQINQERKGTFATPYVNLSAYHHRAGNADEALSYARRAVAVNPNSDRGWFQMARAHERREEWQPALDALKRALAINSNAASYHYVLAAVYRRLGKAEESRAAMETFSRLDRESQELDRKRRGNE